MDCVSYLFGVNLQEDLVGGGTKSPTYYTGLFTTNYTNAKDTYRWVGEENISAATINQFRWVES